MSNITVYQIEILCKGVGMAKKAKIVNKKKRKKEKKPLPQPLAIPPAPTITLIKALVQGLYKRATDWKHKMKPTALTMKSPFCFKTVLHSECHFRNILYLAFLRAKGRMHTHTYTQTQTEQNRWHETSQCHHLLTVRVAADSVRWMKLRWGDSVTLLSLHSWAWAAEFMLISWLRHCVPWRGMCHLPCHLSEQERLVALPRGLPSRSSTADAGEGYSRMETDGTYGGDAHVCPGMTWQEGHYTEDLQ